MKKLFVILIIAFVSLQVIFFIVSRIGKGKSAEKGELARIEKIESSDLTEFVTAPGQIEPKTKVEISAKIAARIIELPHNEGDTVTKGNPNADPPVPASVLIRLDSKDLESNLRSAQASRAAQAAGIEVEKARVSSQEATLKGFEASIERARRDFERQKQLLESKDVSQSTFDQSKYTLDELASQYESAKYSLEAARLNLVVLNHNLEAADAHIEQAQETLGYTVISSPIDGVITRIEAEVGELVMTGTMNNPGTVIIEVANLSKMILAAQVDEADIGRLQLGQDATVRVQAFWNEQFRGKVNNIALSHNLSSNGTKYFKTEILLTEGPLKKLYSGLTADVDIQTQIHKDIIKVPSQAILARRIDDLPVDIRNDNPNVDTNKIETTVVYRFIDGKSVVTPVKTGPSDMTHTIIESGISVGDDIIIGPYKILETLKHDQPLRDERETEKKESNDKTDPNKP